MAALSGRADGTSGSAAILATKFSKRLKERVQEYEAKIEREKMENEINELYINRLKMQKKYEKSLAPMVFPILEREKRKKNGFHYSEVSTPLSSAFQT